MELLEAFGIDKFNNKLYTEIKIIFLKFIFAY